MQRWADEEEQERSRFLRRNNDNNGKCHNDRGGPSNQRDPMRKHKPDDTVGTVDHTPRGKKGDKLQDQFDKILRNKRCPIHPKSNHSMWECTILRKSFQSAPADAPKKSRTRMMKTTRRTLTGSNSSKTLSTSYLEEIPASPSEPRSFYSEKSFQLSQQIRGH